MGALPCGGVGAGASNKKTYAEGLTSRAKGAIIKTTKDKEELNNVRQS